MKRTARKPTDHTRAFQALEERIPLISQPELVDINTIEVGLPQTIHELEEFRGAIYIVVGNSQLWKYDPLRSRADLHFQLHGHRFDTRCNLAAVHQTLYFTTQKDLGFGVRAHELWRTDGTPGGYLRIPSIAGEFRRDSSSCPVNVAGTLFFSARHIQSNRNELWKADGHVVETVRAIDLNDGILAQSPRELTPVRDTLFFAAIDASGSELWKTDGTHAGTTIVKDIVPGVYGSGIQQLTNVDGRLYFLANERTGSDVLWSSDGTEAGTIRIRPFAMATDLTNVNGTLFFSVRDEHGSAQLWKSDGTDAGTIRVKELEPSDPFSILFHLNEVNGTLLFFVDARKGITLWRSDGTEAGTVPVSEPTLERIGSWGPMNANGTLFFTTGQFAQELWKSDGTEAGTRLVKMLPIPPGAPGEAALGRLFFNIGGPSTLAGLWTSDGTEPGTMRVHSAMYGTAASSPAQLTNSNGVLYFTANNGRSDCDLWKIDIGQLVPQCVASLPEGELRGFTTVGDPFYLTVGGELWRSDGTMSGTHPVIPLNAQWRILGVDGLTNVNGALFFTGWSGGEQALWRSDGTGVGTHSIRQLFADKLTAVGNRLYMVATDSSNGTELWMSDGTPNGTVLVKDISPGPNGSFPQELTDVAGTLFFSAEDPLHGRELWRTDGTEAGTIRLYDASVDGDATVSADPRVLRNVNGVLFYSASDGDTRYNNRELWRSDGTEIGTRRIREIRAGAYGSYPLPLINAGGILYFTADDGPSGRELWRSDGTAAGTVPVKNFAIGLRLGSRIGKSAEVDGWVYFDLEAPLSEQGLWRTDGTEEGTTFVRSFAPVFLNGGSVTYMTNVNGTLYFRADDGVHGLELFKIAPEPAVDLNGDGTVDAADAAMMFAHWGGAGPADLNIDGVVDAADAGLLFTQWTGDPMLPMDALADIHRVTRVSRSDSRLPSRRFPIESTLGLLRDSAILGFVRESAGVASGRRVSLPDTGSPVHAAKRSPASAPSMMPSTLRSPNPFVPQLLNSVAASAASTRPSPSRSPKR